ncbi:MAG: DUF5009 domain-containing protein [Paludibacter sp. 47-17]|nr:MAG: DUF5009 domain-containing protein [Paludibacter sp. SCN 50-10]OJX91824.1 MAG: DUF5009 domain-containing protein [Paludibacter sp. 47-17]
MGNPVSMQRLHSLDALRGFDMMWIISGEIIVHALAVASADPVSVWMSGQLRHTAWHGFTFYDMIFPLFIYIAGISMPFSMGRKLEGKAGVELKRARREVYGALWKRTLILVVCGMVVNGALEFGGCEQTRFASVLGRIAFAGLFAGLIVLNCRLRVQVVVFAVVLLGYWALLMLVPVPGIGAGVLTPEGNLAGYVDRCLLPGRLHRTIYDPEGILSTLPAVATALLGVFTGRFLRTRSVGDLYKGILIGASGLVLLGAGWLWNLVFPVNKILWTSSFVLYAGGWSLLLMAVFYLVVDVWRLKRWSLPLQWIGTNSILIYMASHGVVDFEYSSRFLFGGLVQGFAIPWQEVAIGSGMLIIQLFLLRFLFKKKWFLKV